jgi:CRISPR-associated exonuclease Cas4
MIDEEHFLPLSALQHMAFCPRQCALIHLEQQWAENRFTAEGNVMHEKTDTPEIERRPGIRIVRAMMVRSFTYGLTGKCDVVEYHDDGLGGATILPVEYKRGRPKPDHRDEVQLCSQALCLEEMHDTHIEKGALYYGKNRRRIEVELDDSLRAITLKLVSDLREMMNAKRTPPPIYESKKCDSCSLYEICRPKNLGKSASRYVESMVRLGMEEDE